MTKHWIIVEDVKVSWITQALEENIRHNHRIFGAFIIIAHDAGNAQQQTQDTPDPVLCFIHSIRRAIIKDAMCICPKHEKNTLTFDFSVIFNRRPALSSTQKLRALDTALLCGVRVTQDQTTCFGIGGCAALSRSRYVFTHSRDIAKTPSCNTNELNGGCLLQSAFVYNVVLIK